jgi:murein L,D-transpeptidase YafK
MKRIRIRVVKSRNELHVFDGGELIKTYKCITGSNAGDKQIEGDRKTPEGSFHVVFKNPQSKFHLSLGLNYPNVEDANRGLAAGLISTEQHQALLHDLAHGDLSDESVQNRLWKTPLGGEIFIHGCADGRTATAGCIAVSNSDIEELYALCPVGTMVEIRN